MSSDDKENNNNKPQVTNEPKDQTEDYGVYIKAISEEKQYNLDYFDEFGRPKYEEVVNYENNLRAEMELNSALISDKLEIVYLTIEFKDSQFEKSVKEITQKYKFIRTVRRDGNCFYRAFMFRLFEELSIKKEAKLYNQVVKVVEESKSLCERNNYQWLVFEDFYDVFISEWKFVYQLDPLNQAEYLQMLFSDKEKSNYMIVFIRIFIAAYIKENRILYEAFVDDVDLDSWCLREVEAVDNECDHLQILAVVNAFSIGVIIENLGIAKVATIKFPEDQINVFINLLFRPGHYDILYPN